MLIKILTLLCVNILINATKRFRLSEFLATRYIIQITATTITISPEKGRKTFNVAPGLCFKFQINPFQY
jgi:hypothetical protein